MIPQNLTQNDIPELEPLVNRRYEGIFNVYKTGEQDKFYYYNILRKVDIPASLNEGLIGIKQIDRPMAWTILSFQIYNTIYLWWLLVLINKPKNIFYAEPGIQYKYILPTYIDTILSNIQSQINI